MADGCASFWVLREATWMRRHYAKWATHVRVTLSTDMNKEIEIKRNRKQTSTNGSLDAPWQHLPMKKSHLLQKKLGLRHNKTSTANKLTDADLATYDAKFSNQWKLLESMESSICTNFGNDLMSLKSFTVHWSRKDSARVGDNVVAKHAQRDAHIRSFDFYLKHGNLEWIHTNEVKWSEVVSEAIQQTFVSGYVTLK